MNTFLRNAHQLYDVARAGDASEPVDFSVHVAADGGLFIFSDPPLQDAQASIVYRVTRNGSGVRVQGTSGNQKCLLSHMEPVAAWKSLLPDRVLYSVASPLLTGAGS